MYFSSIKTLGASPAAAFVGALHVPNDPSWGRWMFIFPLGFITSSSTPAKDSSRSGWGFLEQLKQPGPHQGPRHDFADRPQRIMKNAWEDRQVQEEETPGRGLVM